MAVELRSRNTQTQVKHQVLEQYLAAWGGIITTGLTGGAWNAAQRGQPFHSRLIYFDGFSYVGRYLRDQDSPREYEVGSPVIGIKALDKLTQYANAKPGLAVSRIVILYEVRRDYYLELLETLSMEGFENRVKIAPELSSLADGDIAVFHGDATNFAGHLHEVMIANTFMFAFVDPYGPTGIPYEFVRRMVAERRVDVMINWPFLDHQRKTGIVVKKDLTQSEIRLLNNYDRIYRDNKSWRELVDPAGPDDDIELILVNHYNTTLKEMDQELAVKQLRLQFPVADRTMYYLYLTTRNPDGALAMNEVLDKAKLSQHVLRSYSKSRLESQKQGMELMFDTAQYTRGAPPPLEIDIDVLADDIYVQLNTRTVSYREVKRILVLADTDVYERHIASAIRKLRRNGKCSFVGDLRNNTDIQFIGSA